MHVQLWAMSKLAEVEAQRHLEEVAGNMQELAVLESVRMDDGEVPRQESGRTEMWPGHLAAVERMRTALETMDAVTGA